MGEVITPGKFSGNSDYRFLTEEKREIHYLREPSIYSNAMAWGNLGYQMQYSVETLESQLEEEGDPHILQINFDWSDGNWRNPTIWRLYADGYEVASGSGKYARQCFETSAERFRDVCREAVSAANLPTLDTSEYRILKRARAIAAAEPYDNGSCAMGGKPHRIY